uniref:Uncharacterized protein n=1 Tax=Alexandrium andersonii TaxID=327968 RepID=A0A7S2HQ19_9DINO
MVFMLSPFNKRTGGTMLEPGSHRNHTMPGVHDGEAFVERAVAINGQPGDLGVFYGHAWHSKGLNVGRIPRRSLQASVYPYFIKQLQSCGYTISNRVARTLPRHMQNRLGLTGYTSFKHTGQSDKGPHRPLQVAALMLWDALRYGYPTRRPGLQLSRWCALSLLAAPLLLLLGRRCGEALKLLLAVSAGLLLGFSLILEKFQM